MKSLHNILNENILDKKVKVIPIERLISQELKEAEPEDDYNPFNMASEFSFKSGVLSFRANLPKRGKKRSDFTIKNIHREIFKKYGIEAITCPDPINWVDEMDSPIRKIHLTHPQSKMTLSGYKYSYLKPSSISRPVMEGRDIICGGLHLFTASNSYLTITNNKIKIIGKPNTEKFISDDWSGIIRVAGCLGWTWKDNTIQTPQVDMIWSSIHTEFYETIRSKLKGKSDQYNTQQIMDILKFESNCKGLKHINLCNYAYKTYQLSPRGKTWEIYLTNYYHL